MQQYHDFKEQHPDCVLFFRMGDFYEMFYEDAKIAHKAMGVTLTQRTKGVPMAGVPYHSVQGYLNRMLAAGYRVAVCDQMENPAQAKGVVRREVTRVLTPGTLTDEALLEEGRQNPLAAVVTSPKGGGAAIAWAELSTGAFRLVSTEAESLVDELARIAPCEVLFEEADDGRVPEPMARIAQAVGSPAVARPAWQFGRHEAVQTIHQQYQVATLDGFGLSEDDPALRAASAIIHYLWETQAPNRDDKRLPHLRPPTRQAPGDYLVIDRTSLASLEIERTARSGSREGSLLACIEDCVTAMGKRTLRQWLCYPLAHHEPIERRQAAVAAMVEDGKLLERTRSVLGEVQDVQRIIGRISVGRATPRDLVGLGGSAAQAQRLVGLLAGHEALRTYHETLLEIADQLNTLADRIAAACVDTPPAHMREGGLIRDGHDAELDECRRLKSDSGAWLSNYQRQLSEQTGIASLKVGYNKVFGYYIEVTAVHRDRAPDEWTRKQTLKNAERFITPELKEYEEKALSAQERAIAREQRLFDDLCALAKQLLEPLHRFANTVADLDVLGCFASCAVRNRYARPRIVDDPVLDIRGGRHPVLDRLLADRFVANDLALGGDADGTLALITGPNMAGKSTYIRQAALITLLAHTGGFVPADAATVGLCDRIFTRIGASDELHTGQSTFMVEMTETARICHHATRRSLVILDEIGRGTSTLDGLSLAWSLTEYLAAKGGRTLFATHYHELTKLADRIDAVVNLNVSVREWKDRIVFLHRIVPGAADRSYGIHVAKLAGIPAAVVERADELLSQLSVNQAGTTTIGPPPDARQMTLFKEYLPHPAVEDLREVDVNTISPLEAFDLLRKLREKVSVGAAPEEPSPAN